jgi:ribose transport system substrate-binding protein
MTVTSTILRHLEPNTTTTKEEEISMRSKGRQLFPAVALLLVLSVALAAVLSGCGSSTSKESKKYRIVMVTGDNHDPFFITMLAGAKMEAKKLGVDFSWQGPANYQAQEQIPVLDAVFASKPDFLIAVPTDVNALVAPLKKFTQAGIPVLNVDGDVRDKSVRLGLIASNNYLGGQIAVRQLAKLLPAGSKVAYVGEQRGVYATDERERGFKAELKKTKLVFVGSQYGLDDPNTAASLTSALFTRYPDLKGVFASDTAYGQGAATAVKNAGKSGQVKIIAFDAEPGEVQALKRGLISMLIVQKCYDEGIKAVQLATAYLKDGTKPPKLWTPGYVLATKDNIDSPSVTKFLYRAS